jgi:hypothetical protein
MKRGMYIALVFMLVSASAFASGDAGQPGAWLQWGASARSLGMAGAYTGLTEDATAVYLNPAGLSQMLNNEATFMHAVLFEGTYYDYLAYVQGFDDLGNFGLGISRLASTGFIGYDAHANPIPDFNMSQTAVMLSWGHDIISILSFGTCLKLVQESIETESDTNGGMDFSLSLHPFYFINIGCNVRNAVAPRLKLRSGSDAFPLSTRVGVACRLFGEKINADVDVEKTAGQVVKYFAGIEGWVHPMVALRAGLNGSETTAGLGFKYKHFQLDYGIGFQDLGTSHRFSFTYNIGGLDTVMTVSPEYFSPTSGWQNSVNIMPVVSSNITVDSWQINVRDSNNIIIRTFNGIGVPPAVLVWDGRDDRQRILQEGKYKIILSVIDRHGRLKTAQVTVEVVKPTSLRPKLPIDITR